MGPDFRPIALAVVGALLVASCAVCETAPPFVPVVDACGSVVGQFETLGVGLARSTALVLPTDLDAAPSSALSETRLTPLLDSVRAENIRLDQLQSVYNQVTECRKAEVRKVRAAFKDGQIERTAADRQLAELRRLYREDLLLARAIGGTMDRRGSALHDAERDLAVLAADKRPVIRRAARMTVDTRRRIAEETASNVAKRNDYVASIAKAEDWRDKGFELS